MLAAIEDDDDSTRAQLLTPTGTSIIYSLPQSIFRSIDLIYPFRALVYANRGTATVRGTYSEDSCLLLLVP